MGIMRKLNNKFITDWLAALPDYIVVCDERCEAMASTSVSELDFATDFFEKLKLSIKGNDFAINAKLILKDFKLKDKRYQIEISKILFLKEYFFYCKFIDTTEVENLNFELEQSRAQQINIARLTELAELAGGISHEISNPLTIVMAKISYLQAKLAGVELGVDKEKITEALAKIIHHSNRITKIIKGLKNFSRNDDKESFVRSDLKELLDEAFLLTIENIKMKGIFVDLSQFDGRYSILCHPVQLVQVLVNLLKNSCDALETTRQPVIKIYSELSDSYIKIFFEDNGPGISPEIQAKIFNPFFTTKPTGKGTGLGLSLSHHIMCQHEGKLFLDIERSSSCFCIQLPIKSL